jgi:hypothetical protein
VEGAKQLLQDSSPYALAKKILEDNAVEYSENSPVFDSLFVRLLCES